MRLQISRDAMIILRKQTTSPEVRRAIEGLLTNPQPELARAIPERPGRYELFVAGVWIVYEVVQEGEGIIRITAVEE